MFGLTDLLIQIYGAWIRRKRTFLEQKPWKSILGTDGPTSQACFDRLLATLASLPGLLEDSDRIRANQVARSCADHCEAILFCNRLIDFLSELFIWRWSWERIHPKGASEITVDPATSISVDENSIPLYRTILSYCGIKQGKQLLSYNTALLVVLDLADDWNIENAPHLALSHIRNRYRASRTNPLMLPHEALSSVEVLSEISRSIEYCLQEPHATVGAVFLLHLVRLLSEPPRVNRFRGWLSCITKTIADLCGAELSEEPNAPLLFAEDVTNIGGPSVRPFTSAR